MDNDQMVLELDERKRAYSTRIPNRSHREMYEPGACGDGSIPGLHYYRDFLEEDVQRVLVDRIDDHSWRSDLERRVQHYGWRYDYRARTVASEMRLGPLPDWIEGVADRLYAETGLFDRAPDQVIVNEYEPGQGIALHVDRDCFGPAVATISLGDDWEMKLRPVGGERKDDRLIMLARGSALVMTGEARFRWMHGIDRRKTEDGGKRRRRRRLSLTFRTVLGPSSGRNRSAATQGPRSEGRRATVDAGVERQRVG